jgi:hypothetical protein
MVCIIYVAFNFSYGYTNLCIRNNVCNANNSSTKKSVYVNNFLLNSGVQHDDGFFEVTDTCRCHMKVDVYFIDCTRSL